MRLCVYALLYQLSFICFTSCHYINHWFIHILYIFCMMYVVRMWQEDIRLQNIKDVTEGVHWIRLHRCPLRKVVHFKGILNWNFLLPHVNFWAVREKYYYVPILTGCQNNSYRIIQRKHLFNLDVMYSSLVLSCSPSEIATENVLQKRRSWNSARYTENTCTWVFFLALLFFLVCCG